VRRVLAILLLAVTAGCAGYGGNEREARAWTGGDPDAGRASLRRYGCTTCHVIPGVPGAVGTVGPPLSGIASRGYLAGRLTNSPANLMRWVQDPRGVDPQTAMPDVGVTGNDARDIAAYLYTLR
jgi:cytochrome c